MSRTPRPTVPPSCPAEQSDRPMQFTASVFLYYFLPAFLGLYYAVPQRFRSYVLALTSYVFYGWWRPDFVVLMWVSTIVDYCCGRAISNAQSQSVGARKYLALSACTNLGLLAYFKYANFGVDTLNALLATRGIEPLAWTAVVLPVGISFYTFQTLSYTVDVYRGHAQPARRLIDFMAYVAMFPQLVAGPIVRYRSVAAQLQSRDHSWGLFRVGMLVFQAGLVKKALVADTLARAADIGFAASSLTTHEAWTAALAYTFQIYFDFSGYSDMAIGLGLMIGFRLPINFDRPYISRSITEFWRRWHISLSAFLRDYLYVPLGGNRKGVVRTYINLGITMLLGGLWHGAAWTFVIWGAYQGFWLIAERLTQRRPLYAALPGPLANVITFLIVVVGWVIFRAETLPQAGRMIGAMFGVSGSTSAGLFTEWTGLETLAMIVAPLVVWGTPTTQAQARSPRTAWIACVTVLSCSSSPSPTCTERRTFRSCISSSDGRRRTDRT